MNDFINFNQRGIDLPAGCKDLIDVLKQAHPSPQPKTPPIRYRLLDLDFFVSEFESSSATRKHLFVKHDSYLISAFICAASLRLFVLSSPAAKAPEIRAFMQGTGLAAAFDQSVEADTWQFQYLLPKEIPLAPLIRELLTEALGANQETPLWIHRQ